MFSIRKSVNSLFHKAFKLNSNANTPTKSKNSTRRNELSPGNNNHKKKSSFASNLDTKMYVQKANTKTSAFHDLHIKSHNNVR